MDLEPQIQERAEQHYAGIPVEVAIDDIAQAVDSAFLSCSDGCRSTVSPRPGLRSSGIS
jgi:hypothetical protein